MKNYGEQILKESEFINLNEESFKDSGKVLAGVCRVCTFPLETVWGGANNRNTLWFKSYEVACHEPFRKVHECLHTIFQVRINCMLQLIARVNMVTSNCRNIIIRNGMAFHFIVTRRNRIQGRILKGLS